MAAVDGAEARGGATLLHRAVRSGSAPLLEGLLAWGAAHDYHWKVQRHCLIIAVFTPVL